MAKHRVTCIVKPHPDSPHEHITYIGSADEKKAWTRDQAISRIEARTDVFYVQTGSNVSTVGVVSPIGRHKYLRTYADGKWNDNLLSLNQCVLAKG